MKNVFLPVLSLFALIVPAQAQEAQEVQEPQQPQEQQQPEKPEFSFRGGDAVDFVDWVQAHLEYPQYAYERMIELEVPVYFTVEPDGSISNVRSWEDADQLPERALEFVDEAIRVVSSAPKWTPATTGKFRQKFAIPVEFAMPKFGKGLDKEPEFLREADEEEHLYRKNIRKWLDSRMSLPEGFRISLTGIVEKSGTLSHMKILSTTDEEMAQGVVEALAAAPKWTPGYDKDGKTVRSFVYLSFTFKDDDAPKDADEEDEGTMPSFRGGDVETFRRWTMSRLMYPLTAQQKGIQGTVLLGFTVGKTGEVVDIETIHSPNELLAKEAIRVVERSPKWTPGIQKGEAVNVYYILPIEFVITR